MKTKREKTKLKLYSNPFTEDGSKVRCVIHTKIRSCIKLARPRLASTNKRVTGPGIPSVYPSAPLPTTTSPPTPTPSSGAFSFSSVCSVPADPPTSYMMTFDTEKGKTKKQKRFEQIALDAHIKYRKIKKKNHNNILQFGIGWKINDLMIWWKSSKLLWGVWTVDLDLDTTWNIIPFYKQRKHICKYNTKIKPKFINFIYYMFVFARTKCTATTKTNNNNNLWVVKVE